MSRHTPGPWSVGGFGLYVVEDGEKLRVAAVERAEDVALVAAAPEMLEALKAMLSGIGPDGYVPSAGKTATDRARAAVAKAEGKP